MVGYIIIKNKIMAINVDLVYKTVLLILNQQQRGYITPDEFNKVGNQVQQGIFEKYASDLNQQLRIPENDSEYANRVKNLEEKLDIFKRIATPTFSTDHFTTASLPNFYRLGTVIHKDVKMVQMVERNEFYLIQKSPLTAATISQPIFLYEDTKISVYPTSITSDIQVSYLKQPAIINWGYSVGSLGQYIYNASSSVNFELHPSEQVDVITGILLYSGVIIQDPTIIQVASQQIQQEDINEKS
mgnify:CR=1 FL=1